ncbi:hypothetical protein L1887_44435 [Cichorium endivia]|nr:hypothetical protein L1887_44435 [Cichorium endivia]
MTSYCLRVTGINISGFKRTRAGRRNPQFAVDSLANLTNLASFNASRFKLPGSIPNGLGFQLQALQVLDLRFCQIFGAILSTLGNLSNLHELYLSDNSLTGTIPSTLSQLSHLSVLDLSRNSLTGLIPSSFGSLSNLSSLDILSSSIPTQLGNITTLKFLDLSSNSFSGSLPFEFTRLENLQTLSIGNNLLMGNLSGNLFSPSKLQTFSLNHNNFTGNLPVELFSLPSLIFIDASDNNFTGSLLNLDLNPNVTSAVLNLSHNTLYGELTFVLRKFNSVDLSYNYFMGTVPDSKRFVALNKNFIKGSPAEETSGAGKDLRSRWW